MSGARGWFKVRRQTTEAVIGAITGTLARPQLLVLGRYDAEGQLRAVGRTTPLKPTAARQLADHLTEAGPDHPWTGVLNCVERLLSVAALPRTGSQSVKSPVSDGPPMRRGRRGVGALGWHVGSGQ
ncbi:hypothetical protein ACIHCQ_29460 [Streptomyces sp. NPDC052236]|uniref:hypothetical protein n=1 Tax=Streptomyces sp. NPDC052236 TaxID=3365686 RepID=UPI0037CEB343